ncbi:MAG: RHS repeat protein, partial [Planctomycetota bacterium]
MVSWTVLSSLVSLALTDTPLRYTPPRGPAISLKLRYNQREAYQPQIFSYWNLGTRWTTDWFAYVEDDPANAEQPASTYHRGGGVEISSGFSSTTGSYGPERRSRAVLVRVSADPVRYERRLSDGSVEEYGQPDGALTSPRKVFLTRVIDADGNAVRFTYDEQLRLVAVTDAVGQVTTLSYDEPADPLKVTAVADPFGRVARFDYDSAGRLGAITDVMGLTSSFDYDGDFVRALTTPYGVTRFRITTNGADRSIEISDALGGRERLDFRVQSAAARDPAPLGFNSEHSDYRNTLYWDKKAMDEAPGEISSAHILHWLHTTDWLRSTGTIESEKRPLESRIYRLYPGQPVHNVVGEGLQPSAIGRLLEDGTSQIRRFEYNVRGMKTREIDPLGRETVYVYGTGNVPDPDAAAGTGLDLLQVKQKNPGSPGGWDVLASYTYDGSHRILTATDAAGQPTTYSYTVAGQIETVTNAKNETTTYSYDSDGRLQSVTGPVPGTTTTYEYDDYGRLWRVTDSENYTTTTEYDVFDRPTKVTYPDGTWEETAYERLDAVKHRDRMGRWTETFYDALRRPVAMRDPAGRMVQKQYCRCGDGVEKLVDANGNPTSWERDIQGRVTREIRANGAAHAYS